LGGSGPPRTSEMFWRRGGWGRRGMCAPKRDLKFGRREFEFGKTGRKKGGENGLKVKGTPWEKTWGGHEERGGMVRTNREGVEWS